MKFLKLALAVLSLATLGRADIGRWRGNSDHTQGFDSSTNQNTLSKRGYIPVSTETPVPEGDQWLAVLVDPWSPGPSLHVPSEAKPNDPAGRIAFFRKGATGTGGYSAYEFNYSIHDADGFSNGRYIQFQTSDSSVQDFEWVFTDADGMEHRLETNLGSTIFDGSTHKLALVWDYLGVFGTVDGQLDTCFWGVTMGTGTADATHYIDGFGILTAGGSSDEGTNLSVDDFKIGGDASDDARPCFVARGTIGGEPYFTGIFDSNDNSGFYALDIDNEVLVKFDYNGTFITQTDISTDAPNAYAGFQAPNGTIYITTNQDVAKYSSSLVFQSYLPLSHVNGTDGVTCDSGSNVYVSGYENSCSCGYIQKFSPTGISIWDIQSTDDNGGDTEGLAINQAAGAHGTIYACNPGDFQVRAFDMKTGATLFTFGGTEGTGDGEFEYPEQVAIGPGGQLAVTDWDGGDSARIQLFTPAGVFVSKFGVDGPAPGQLLGGSSFTFAKGARLFVTDGYEVNVDIFDCAFDAVTPSPTPSPTPFVGRAIVESTKISRSGQTIAMTAINYSRGNRAKIYGGETVRFANTGNDVLTVTFYNRNGGTNSTSTIPANGSVSMGPFVTRQWADGNGYLSWDYSGGSDSDNALVTVGVARLPVGEPDSQTR